MNAPDSRRAETAGQSCRCGNTSPPVRLVLRRRLDRRSLPVLGLLLLFISDLPTSRGFQPDFLVVHPPRAQFSGPQSTGVRRACSIPTSRHSLLACPLHLFVPSQENMDHSKHHRFTTRKIPTTYRRVKRSSSFLQRCRGAPLFSVIPSIPLPLVESSDAWGNWAVLLGSAALAQVWGTTTSLGKLLGPPVTAMALSFAMATLGVLTPGGTPAAQQLQTLALQLATPLILLGASNALRKDAIQQCGPLLFSFALASLATLVACLVGWYVAGPSLQSALGVRDGLVLAAALLAKNVGGGINYIAVCQALQASPTAVAAGLCVDNLFALVYFPATSALASGRPDVVTHAAAAPTEDNTALLAPRDEGNDNDPGRPPSSNVPATVSTTFLSVQSVTNVLCGAATLLWLSDKFLGGGLPACTILTLLVAHVAPRSWIAPLQGPADCLGTVALYVFFATAGAPGLAVADSVRASLLPLGTFLACLYSVHGLLLSAAHHFGQRYLPRRFRPSVAPQRLLVASSAAIGGPATAIALAQASHWESLKVPGLLVGNLGYVIATFAGLAYFALLGGNGDTVFVSGLGAVGASALRVV